MSRGSTGCVTTPRRFCTTSTRLSSSAAATRRQPNAETIDLSQAQPAWQATDPMNFPRRQHNATILPDGTVLVTGGTRSGGIAGTRPGIQQSRPGAARAHRGTVGPATGHWTKLAAEQTDRCYHSTAVLLPDGRVLSAGSGEFVLNEGTPQQQQNDPQDSTGRPGVLSPLPVQGTPARNHLGPGFGSPRRHVRDRHRPARAIATVTLVRLSSATHSFNAGQRINFLPLRSPGGDPHGDRAAQRGRLPARALHALHR